MTKTPVDGFTLVETLVAITLLTISIAGPLYIAERSFSAARSARDQTIASYLAQEGIEYIRFIRDNNLIARVSWLTNLGECSGGNSCTVDSTVAIGGSDLVTCPGGVCPALMYRSTDRLYNQGSATAQNVASKYTRTVTIATVSANEVLVTSQVRWLDRGATRTTTYTERLFAWQ